MRRLMALAISFLATCIIAPQSDAADPKPIKIGVLTDMSSVYADVSGTGSVTAATLAAEDAGLVLGRPVEIVFADHQNKPDIAAAIARRWYEVEGVDMITDVNNSGVGAAVQNVSSELKKLTLVTGALSSELTGLRCTPYYASWAMDTWGQANILGKAITRGGSKSWFFIGANYKFGKDLVQDASKVIEANGGKVLGSVFAPLNSSDFSSFLLQAQSSGAEVIGLANAAADTLNSIKQAAEFGITANQKFAAFVIFLTDVKSIGLKLGQGLQMSVPYYWDLDDGSRTFASRIEAKIGRKPVWNQAAVYSVVAHYLKAVKSVASNDSDAVMKAMRATPINDFMSKDAKLRIDGRVERDTYLFEVKKPEESQGPWDLLKLVTVVPGKEATRPLDQGGCPLVSALK
jgi:branched-chain amino acid transport system substrate-binding protein